MEREVGRAVQLAVELLITSVVLAVVIVFSSSSSVAYNFMVDQKTADKNVAEYAELYEYNNRLITGSDVVDLILTYTRIYRFNIRNSDGSLVAVMDYDSEGSKGINYWSRENITDIMGDYMTANFVSKIDFGDESNSYIRGITFIRE